MDLRLTAEEARRLLDILQSSEDPEVVEVCERIERALEPPVVVDGETKCSESVRWVSRQGFPMRRSCLWSAGHQGVCDFGPSEQYEPSNKQKAG
jgi:hypothetical protein